MPQNMSPPTQQHKHGMAAAPPTAERLEVVGSVFPCTQLQLVARGQLSIVWRLCCVEPALDAHAGLVTRVHLLRI